MSALCFKVQVDPLLACFVSCSRWIFRFVELFIGNKYVGRIRLPFLQMILFSHSYRSQISNFIEKIIFFLPDPSILTESCVLLGTSYTVSLPQEEVRVGSPRYCAYRCHTSLIPAPVFLFRTRKETLLCKHTRMWFVPENKRKMKVMDIN